MRPRLGPRSACAIAAATAAALAALAGLERLRSSDESASAISASATSASITSASATSAPTLESSLARDPAGCARVRSSEWHPLSGLEYTGRLDVWLPAADDGAIVFYIGDAVWLDIEAVLPGGAPLLIARERRDSVLAPDVPPDYWLDDGIPWRAPPRITRIRVEAAADRERAFMLALGRRAPRVVARLSGYPSDVRALVCARPIAPGEVYFATGWYGREHDAAGQPLRWMREHGAVVLPSGRDGPVRVRVRARPAASVPEPVLLTMTVNEVFEAPALEMRAGFADYVWEVPDRAWVPGANELFFEVSRTIVRGHRTLGMALASVAVE